MELPNEYHVHIWQVSAQLSWKDKYESGAKDPRGPLVKSDISLMEKLTNWVLVTTSPDQNYESIWPKLIWTNTDT